MTLFPDSPSSPLDEVCVALDLETTGLNARRDAIIEVGAAKFRGEEELDSFHSLVNPWRTLPSFVAELTGITQREVNAAPLFGAVAPELAAFIGGLPIVGHSIGFDLAFLTQGGLELANPRYDTLDLASVFLPSARGYSLGGLVRALGLVLERPHRALEDARASHQLFVHLVRRALEEEVGVLAAMGGFAARSSWSLGSLVRELAGAATHKAGGAPVSTGILGVDTAAVEQRLGRSRPLRPRPGQSKVDEEVVAALLAEGGLLERAFPGYEHRPQQREMAHAVTQALKEGHHLMVEAGTGVGKSVAYLLPALLFSMASRRRVVVSTNTINLQEQLISKDIPDLLAALGSSNDEGPPVDGLGYTHLKGRENYLCFRRWANLAQSDNLSAEEARMLAKTLVWLCGTASGDRAELNIPRRDAYVWERLSARGAGECEVGTRGGPCFLRAARNRAEGSHVVVVNHALLLSDLATGGGLIPRYDHVIIDEAHHLEEEASRQFGYEISPQRMEQVTERLGWLAQSVRSVASASGAAGVSQSWQADVESRVKELESVLLRLRQAWGRLTSSLTDFHAEHGEGGNARMSQLRVTRNTRTQPGWSELEIQWEAFDETAAETMRQAERLETALEPLEYAPLADPLIELGSWLEETRELRERLRRFLVQPEEETVYWMSLNGQEGAVTLSAAPLNVGPKLRELLFSKKESVVLTSATLSIQGSLAYHKARLGAEDAKELLLGSPFDYKRAALLLLPTEMPEPTEPSYGQAIEESLIGLARGSRGGMLALFTSHAALQAARSGIKATLDADGIEVLGQGVDGSPRQIAEAAMENPQSVILGTASFWEGVDLPGELLRVLVVARLPFGVPTEPVFAARSELYADPFNEYALLQAVLRFRQGFGRLIRSHTDRGVVVVLDSRVRTRAYGSVFLRSIPRCTEKTVTARAMGEEVRRWLEDGGKRS